MYKDHDILAKSYQHQQVSLINNRNIFIPATDKIKKSKNTQHKSENNNNKELKLPNKEERISILNKINLEGPPLLFGLD